MTENLEAAWKGAVVIGLVGLNFKLVLEGIRSVRERKNGKSKRKIRYLDECNALHKDLHKETDEKAKGMWETINKTAGNVEYIKGVIDTAIKGK